MIPVPFDMRPQQTKQKQSSEKLSENSRHVRPKIEHSHQDWDSFFLFLKTCTCLCYLYLQCYIMYYIIYFWFCVIYLLLPIFKPQEVHCWPIRELFMVAYDWPRAGQPGFDSQWEMGSFPLSPCSYRFWGPPTLLTNKCWRLFPKGYSDCSMKLTSQFHRVPRLKMHEYLDPHTSSHCGIN